MNWGTTVWTCTICKELVRKALSAVAPAVKEVGKVAIGEISKAGLNTLAGTVQGEDVQESLRKNTANATKRAAAKISKSAKKARRDVFSQFDKS